MGVRKDIIELSQEFRQRPLRSVLLTLGLAASTASGMTLEHFYGPQSNSVAPASSEIPATAEK